MILTRGFWIGKYEVTQGEYLSIMNTYDMEGNVVEWCQDWFGFLPGGVQTDPTGPASNPSGRKVTRGGALDNTQQTCRSAARSMFPAGPSDSDTDLGFRVVLGTEPQ